MDEVERVYASCRSYRDEGMVETVFVREEGEKTDLKPFSTAFIRPDRFRFEYRHRKDGHDTCQMIVWAGGDAVRKWNWHMKTIELKAGLLAGAIAGATGVSGGSARTIPRLLMPSEVRGRSLADLNDLKLVGEAELDGVRCHLVEGIKPSGSTSTIWVDEENKLVRKMVTSMQFADFRTLTTTTYSPQIDVEISPDELSFSPPE